MILKRVQAIMTAATLASKKVSPGDMLLHRNQVALVVSTRRSIDDTEVVLGLLTKDRVVFEKYLSDYVVVCWQRSQ